MEYFKSYQFKFLILLLLASCNTDNKITYISNPSLHNIRSDWKGNILLGNRFSNNGTEENYSFYTILKWKLGKNPQKAEKKKDTFRIETIKTTDFVNSKKDMIVWFGHSSFFIRINGIVILTDPAYYNIPFVKRLASMPCNPTQIKGVNYVLVSHNHRDHLDIHSIEDIFKANPDAKALIPLRMDKQIKHYTKNIEEAGWYQQYTTSDKIKIFLMPAHHWCRRGLFDHNKALWGSFIIQTDSTTIYFAGDTKFDTHFEEIAKLFPKIDYALIPVGAYKPKFIMEKAHISPWEAVDVIKILKAKVFVPMHYGTYDLSDEPIGEPVRVLDSLNDAGKISAQLKFLKIGEELLIK